MSEDRPSETSPISILCAEDNYFVRQAMLSTLRRAGYQVECAEDGAIALKRLLEADKAFDVLITDQEMPNMTGLELVTELCKKERSHKTIVLSGNLTERDAREFRKLGVGLILSKPCLPAHVLEGVVQVLRIGSAAAQGMSEESAGLSVRASGL